MNQVYTKKKKERLDWLYEPPMLTKTQSTEEYLLGKPFEDPKDKEDFSTPGLFQNKPQSSANDSWNRLREDPLLSIKRQEQTIRDNIRNNPVEMKLIKDKLIKLSKKKKKLKKVEKKLKKERKKKAKQSSESDKEDEKSKEKKNKFS